MLRCFECPTETPAADSSRQEIDFSLQVEQCLQARLLRPIRVHICENELQIFGHVSSWHEKQQAQELAREVAPMYQIRNELRITDDHGKWQRR